MKMDMTVGSPTKIIINFTIPIIIGNIFIQLYSAVDMVIVGQFAGTTGLAAIGAVSSITNLTLSLIGSIAVGFTVLVAQRFGARDLSAMRKFIANAYYLALVISILLTVILCAYMKPLLRLLNTGEEIFQDAYTYATIFSIGIIVQVAYNLFSNILRAIGNSKAPLFFLILASLLNVVLDLIFITVFQMGVAGAAYATIISQAISALLCLVYIMKKAPILHLTREDCSIDFSIMQKQLSIAFPMAFQYVFASIGAFIIQASLNTLGTTAIAAYTASGRVGCIFMDAMLALATTLTNFSAQNYGAGNYDRIRRGFRTSTIIGAVFAMCTSVILWTVGKYATYLFVAENADAVVHLVDIYLKCYALAMIPLMILGNYRSGIQGMGYRILPMIAGIIELVVCSIISVIGAKKESYFLVCLTTPAAWVAAAAYSLILYFYIMKNIRAKQTRIT